jgi:dTMP kinase
MNRGRLIVLEGMDGSGKSSQVGAVARWLADRGRQVVSCRDPGSTPVGDAIREILLHRHDLQMTAEAEMFLYMAARSQLVREVIVPALEAGSWVVSDRFLMSNIVYQGHAGGLDPEQVRLVGGLATGGLEPDLTLLLDVDLDTVDCRLNRPLDRLEARGRDYRQRLRDGYRSEAARAAATVIDATADLATVSHLLIAAVAAAFPELGQPEVDG